MTKLNNQSIPVARHNKSKFVSPCNDFVIYALPASVLCSLGFGSIS